MRPVPENQESNQKFGKLVSLLRRELEELKDRLDSSEYRVIDDAVKAANEFREIMRDLEALVTKDMDYFNVVTRVWRRRDGSKVCDVTVKGHSVVFTAEDIDCNTSIDKVLETVLEREDNILYAFSRAFLVLENFGSAIEKAMDLKERIENLEKEVRKLKDTLNFVERACK